MLNTPLEAEASLGRDGRKLLHGRFKPQGGYAWHARIDTTNSDTPDEPYRSTVCLYEDGLRLHEGHSLLVATKLGGAGRYQHWVDGLYFSATDGSDPNTNGRQYTYDYSLTLENWQRDKTARAAQRWLLHPEGRKFLERGGKLIPPPLTANLGLTNKCNLRCEICGSQKHLDNTGVRRRHMQFSTFEAVAETIFPMLSIVELNSQGDPLLHPQIEQILGVIEAHKCEVKIQHNGTLLRDSIVDLLLRQHGSVNLSLDAVGARFDEVRRGGQWDKAVGGLERLLRERDPKRLTIGVYPTLTARTIGEAMNVTQWCSERGIDEITFHRYVPVEGSSESPPSDEDYARACEEIREWGQKHSPDMRVMFEGEFLIRPQQATRREEYVDVEKATATYDSGKFMFPVEFGVNGSDPFTTCAAPNEYVEIGLDGQIGACCRAQDVTLGYATSVDAFADAWFGRNYSLLRDSLKRGATGAYPLPNCEGCVKAFAPGEARDRCSVNYSVAAQNGEERLRVALGDSVILEKIHKEDGFGHASQIPLGIHDDYELWEDGRRLGPGRSEHADIRTIGKGQFDLGGNTVHFSTSDGSDARRNGRTYSLRLKRSPKAGEPVAIDGIRKEEGLCFTAALPPGLSGPHELWEDDRKLGPGRADHGDIRAHGAGQHDTSSPVIHFSTSDGSDPRINGRTYFVRSKQPFRSGDPLELDHIRTEQGKCFTALLPAGLEGDLELWENDVKLGPGKRYHDDIRGNGAGRYAIGEGSIYFSTSDGSDPRLNGRTYTLKPAASSAKRPEARAGATIET